MLLAVSGGLDSMSLMHAMAAVARSRIAAVATFDHGTGSAATRAAAEVRRAAARLGLAVVAGRPDAPLVAPQGREDAWRRARYEFLRGTAARLGARVVTAHTEDDQVETVLMRVLRGAGARGLSALYAPSDIARPFLALRRAALVAYATESGVTWSEDPTNRSPSHLRNRVRHDLLPALRRVAPGIDADLLSLARRAADWRREVEAWLDREMSFEPRRDGGLDVASAELTGHDPDSLGILWSALAGRAGVSLDRRGTRRLAEFTSSGASTGKIPLSGGWIVEARASRYLLYRPAVRRDAAVGLPERGSVDWGGFRFMVAGSGESRDAWSAAVPVGAPGVIRPWRDGDRLETSGGQPRRRVKRYLSEAGVRGPDRAGWPVVAVAGDVVWIPGVRRSDAATERSGRPVRHYVCARIDR